MIADPIQSEGQGPVSRRRYLRERTARLVAEGLLEAKSRELYEANRRLQEQAEELEQAVLARTREAFEAAAARVDAEKASDAKSNFLASMSHEIRTPLHGVLGMASALEDTVMSADQREMLAVITESGRVLRTVIDDVLDLSKIEADKLELSPEVFYLPEMFKTLEHHYGQNRTDAPVSAHFEMTEAIDCWVRGDEMRLRQVIGNLLSNAKKFTEQGFVRLSADMQSTADGKFLNVEVADSGIGLSDEVKARLFKPFEQANAKIAHKFGGSGLGLVISRKICHLMGGTLRLDGAPGCGAVARFDVCLEAASPRKDQLDEADVAEAEKLLSARPWKIVVADDSTANRKVIMQFLKKFELELVEATNGAEAVEAWRKLAPDMVLMDINMPVMGGVAASLLIRQEGARLGHLHVPIIAVTANAMSHQVEDYLEAGLDAHLAKPVSRKKLITVMAHHLRAQL